MATNWRLGSTFQTANLVVLGISVDAHALPRNLSISTTDEAIPKKRVWYSDTVL